MRFSPQRIFLHAKDRRGNGSTGIILHLVLGHHWLALVLQQTTVGSVNSPCRNQDHHLYPQAASQAVAE